MEKSDIDDLITRYPILSTFEEPDVTRIIDESRIARFSKGTMLRDRKESVDSVVFVKEGMLRVYTNDGDKQMLLFYVPEGQLSVTIISRRRRIVCFICFRMKCSWNSRGSIRFSGISSTADLP